jgi:hypothetical protein
MNRLIAISPLLLSSLVFFAACNGEDDAGVEDNFGVLETDGTADCENLEMSDCFYPFPSRHFVRSGQLELPLDGLPEGEDNDGFTPDSFRRFAAFGAATPILFQLDGAVIPDVTPFDAGPSLSATPFTVLVDASTGERIPHWVELDYLSADMDPTLFTIRPSIALPRDTEVVVGVLGWTDESGATVDAPAPFAALRDETVSEWLGIHERREHYESVVFPALDGAGVSRADLQLAWSFPVRSSEDATSTMLGVRDAIFDALPEAGPDYRIDNVLVCDGGGDDPAGCHPSIRVILDGTSFVPSAVDDADELGLRHIRRNDAGVVVVDGVEEWPFRVQIPHSAFDGDGPVPVLQYGHGFLGSGGEANSGWLREMADRIGFVVVSTSMQGMEEGIASTWIGVLLADGGKFPELQDLALQGVGNQLVHQRMMKTSLAADDTAALYREDGDLAWDPSRVYYTGNSQGGSVGTVVMGTSLDVERGVLGVPGSGYPILLHRSTVFGPFSDIIATAYPEDDAVARFLALLGTGWDDFDPLTFAPHIHGDPLPGTPDHAVILHVAKEDQQVHNEASFISGRTMGASLMVPAVRPVFGLPEATYPSTLGATVVEVDFGIPDDPTPLTPPEVYEDMPNGGDTHGWLRQYHPAQDQMFHFFETGEVIDVCGGVACVSDGRP